MKLVFMGTPVYALSCLEALIGAGHEIAAVFTQPDKPKNRGKQIQMTPVKELALKHEIPVSRLASERARTLKSPWRCSRRSLRSA